MEMETKYGQTAVSIKDNGNRIKLMEKEYFITQMEIFMRVNGLMIKLMAKGHILTRMEPSILENGRMINNMGLEFRNGLMEKSMKDSIEMEQKREKES